MSAHYRFSHPAEVVFDKLTDPDFLVQRGLALGEKNIRCDSETDGRKTQVVLARTVHQDLPAFLAKLFGAENRTVMTEDWEQIGHSWSGQYRLEVEGQPVSLSARFQLKPNETGCEYRIDYQCKARIPLVGSRVETFILDQTENGMRREMDYLAQILEHT